jgi:hypothetical protein
MRPSTKAQSRSAIIELAVAMRAMVQNALMNFQSLLCAVAINTFLSGCATVQESPQATGRSSPPVPAPKLGLFSSIKVPSDREPVMLLTGKGVQIFRCEKHDNDLLWVFRQPEAELIDPANGKVMGRHGASFSFEHVDGSRLIATVAAYDDAPQPTDLRWLLLTTRSFNRGAFEGVTQVQRINTKGGIPPARCETVQSGKLLRVDFSADFVFYRPKTDPH